MFALLPVWSLSVAELQGAMQRLSLVAQASVAAIVVTGGYATLLYLSSFSDLVSSSYGTVLSLKITFFALAISVAALNHRRFLPKLLAAGSTSSFRRAMFVELAFLLLVVGFTGALTLTDQP